MNKNNNTHFGFKTIPSEDKDAEVAAVFESIAAKYDVMNDLMTAGMHRLWKRYAIELTGVRPGHVILDLAGGTGDLALRLCRLVGKDGLIVLSDINESMLQMARDRIMDSDCVDTVNFIQANGQELPFADNTFDSIVIAFGWRDFTNKQRALDSMTRALKPGGRLVMLEFSKPKGKLFNKLYDSYSFGILPRLGKLVTGNRDAYRYIAESIRVHPDQKTVKGMMQKAGLRRVEFHDLSSGLVSVHRGFKI